MFKRPEFWVALVLLLASNAFMTLAWYGHLKFKDRALWLVILASWGIAFFEYCLQVPANRIGSDAMTPSQLKVLQEVVTFAIFSIFTVVYFRQWPTLNDVVAFGLVVIAVLFSLVQPL